ncbi:hypothetical protein Gohar_003434, partial [Gossypium harknessii]|nr:hypothetical protein [Gossypium harknessii]
MIMEQLSFVMKVLLQCYSKFGDAVFTLTRFFRDGGSCTPAKPELADQKTLDPSPSSTKPVPDEIKTAQALDESYTEKLPVLSTSMDLPHSKHKLSSLLDVKSSNNLSHLRDIPPANLSCFTPYKQQSKEQQLCSVKKRKALLIEHDKSSNVNASDAQRSVPRDLPFTDDGGAEVDAKFLNHKKNYVCGSSEQLGAEETEGSAFLIQ